MPFMYKVFRFKRVWLMTAFILVLSHPVHSQYYDLAVGVERHYAFCAGLTGVCPAGVNGAPTTEKVIDEVSVNGNDYAVVTFTGWARDYESGELIAIFTDTTYYRMEGSVLYEFNGEMETKIFDFGFAKGDSIMNHIGSYVEGDNPENYGVWQQEVASVILIDTLLQFIDGSIRNILWGDDTYVTSIGQVYLPPEKLEFLLSNNLPVPQYLYNRPFYYISGIGVILTPFNHRRQILCGFKTSEGIHFGCYAPQYTSLDYDPIDIAAHNVLIRNYPNPFNPSTTINYTLIAPGIYRLLLYTASGNLVSIINEGNKPPGEYHYYLSMRNYASGVYFVVLEQGSYRYTLPITLIK